jgi:AmmeMemoRadiSam system protein A
MEKPYVKLARMAVENYIKEGKIIEPPNDLPEEFFKEKCGVFVSIHKGKELRGCIGTYLPTKENLAKEIISNAISAAQDPRFLPIQKGELPFLSYEVYLLEEPKPVKSLEELDPKKYGILVRSLDSEKSGLLLPDLEGIEKKEEQIWVACQKAGINPLKEKIIIYKFSARKYD